MRYRPWLEAGDGVEPSKVTVMSRTGPTGPPCYKLGVQGGIRTHNHRALNTIPLPVGLHGLISKFEFVCGMCTYAHTFISRQRIKHAPIPSWIGWSQNDAYSVHSAMCGAYFDTVSMCVLHE